MPNANLAENMKTNYRQKGKPAKRPMRVFYSTMLLIIVCVSSSIVSDQTPSTYESKSFCFCAL